MRTNSQRGDGDSDRERQPRKSPNRGSNQVSVRGYNERLILQLLRHRGSLTKAEIGRATGLSPNAVAVIIRALEGALLVTKETPIRGRVGQPSSPIRLNADARYSFGLRIGRRGADLVIADFVGNIRASKSIFYPYPEPEPIRSFLKDAIRQTLKDARKSRGDIMGFGIAMPFELWHWTEEIGAPPKVLDAWRDLQPGTLLPRNAPWTVIHANDATAACVAETTFAGSDDVQDAIYLFVGTLIGGGVILNGGVFYGRNGNAGGFGPFRVPGGAVGSDRLIDHASLIVLGRLVEEAGHDPTPLYEDTDHWAFPDDIVERWIELASRGIAHSIASSLSIIEFEAVIIDGSLPPPIRDRLVERVRSTFLAMDLQGLNVPEISAGHYGSIARALGAAALPLNEEYSINQNNLLRDRRS